jgi:hypothetical protein
LINVGDYETVTSLGPIDDGIGWTIFDHIVTFFQERCNRRRNRTIIVARCFHHSIV